MCYVLTAKISIFYNIFISNDICACYFVKNSFFYKNLFSTVLLMLVCLHSCFAEYFITFFYSIFFTKYLLLLLTSFLTFLTLKKIAYFTFVSCHFLSYLFDIFHVMPMTAAEPVSASKQSCQY